VYRIILECDGVPVTAGEEASRDITEEFRAHYPHEKNVVCSWDGRMLRLISENDYDSEGLNLTDQFSDTIAAYIEPFDGDIRLVSIEIIP
jgi:hypothetical protein